MIPRRWLVVLALALSALAAPPAAGAAEPPWVGAWGTDEAACAFGDEAGGHVVTLAADAIEESGRRCEIVDVSGLGRGKWWLEAECETGVALRRRYLLTLDDGDLVVTFLSDGWRENRFRRCP